MSSAVHVARKIGAISVIVLAFATISACGTAGLGKPVPKQPTWSYHGETGPAKWATLDKEFATCAGMNQSPVDFSGSFVSGKGAIMFNYNPSPLAVENKGHGVYIYPEKGKSSITIAGKSYELLQYHFHAPSEHTEKGKPHSAELHFVHAAADGEYAVIGVFFDAGKENEVVKAVLENIPAKTGETVTAEAVFINPINLIPQKSKYYHYTGSLTTPPCTEGINWNVLVAPKQLSKQQVEKLMELGHGPTARPAQPLNGRKLNLKK